MRITYDQKADALAIILCEGARLEDSVDLEDGVTAMLDTTGHVIGLEILEARERLGDEAFAKLTIERLPLMLRSARRTA